MRISSSLITLAVGLVWAGGSVHALPLKSPAGNWQLRWTGSGNVGVTYATFNMEGTWTGYGAFRDAFGPVVMAGQWWFDAKGQVQSSYTQTANDIAVAGTLTAKLPGNGKLSGKAVSTAGTYHVRGTSALTAGGVPAVGGTWLGKVLTDGAKYYETQVVTAAHNLPGVFDIAGHGVSPSGSYRIAGQLIVTSDRFVNGFTFNDYGSAGVVSNSFEGRFNAPLTKVTYRGKSADGKHLTIRAERQ